MFKGRKEEERLALAKERNIVVDPEDQWLLATYTWHVNSVTGYVKTNIIGIRPALQAPLHHCIMGAPINGFDVYHKDRNKQNNKRSNLRYYKRKLAEDE